MGSHEAFKQNRRFETLKRSCTHDVESMFRKHKRNLVLAKLFGHCPRHSHISPDGQLVCATGNYSPECKAQPVYDSTAGKCRCECGQEWIARRGVLSFSPTVCESEMKRANDVLGL